MNQNLQKVKDQDIRNFGADIFQLLHDGEYEETFNGEKWGSPLLKFVLDIPEFEYIQEVCDTDSDYSAYCASKFIAENGEQLQAIKNKLMELEDKKKEYEKNESEELEDEIMDLEIDLESMEKYAEAQMGQSMLSIMDSLSDVNELELKGLLPSKVDDDQDARQSEKRWDVIERLVNDDNFKGILELAGRVQSLGDNSIYETTDTPEEFLGFTMGNQIDGIQAEDLAMIGEEVLEDVFWADYSDEALLIDNYRGTKQLGYGDVIICSDISDSMNDRLGSIDDVYVSRHQICRAFAYAMHCDIKDRKVLEVCFNNGVRTVTSDPLESIEVRARGGTNFNKPLRKALSESESMNNPDIVFITDGEGYPSEELLKQMQEKGIRLWLYTITSRGHNSILLSHAHKAFKINSDINKSIENLAEAMNATK